MKKLNTGILFLLALVLMLIPLFGACTTEEETKTETTETPTETETATATGPQYGGVLKIITPGSMQNLGVPGDPEDVSTDGFIRRTAVEMLVTLDPELKGIIYPELATDWEWSPDYKALTLTLRQGVKFHDGTDFNAEAVKYNLEMEAAGAHAPDLRSVESIDVIDDYTVRLNVPGYESSLLSSLGGPIGWMISPTALKTMSKDELHHNPVGTGPFKFASYERDASIRFERFDGYWKGKPYLDAIEWIFIADPVTQLLSFKAGEAQAIRGLSAKDAADLKAEGFNIHKYVQDVLGLAGDSAKPASSLSEIKIRQAIAYAINNEAIADTVGYGLYEATNQWYPREKAGYNPAITGYPYDPQKARELLAEAAPDGIETTLLYMAADTLQGDVFAAVQGYLSEVGISVQLDPADTARFLESRGNGWNGLIYMWSPQALGVEDCTGLKPFQSSRAIYDTTGSLYVPEDYDAKLWQAVSEPDYEKRMALLREASKMLIDDYCVSIPILTKYGFTAYTSDVHDFELHLRGMGDWYPEKTWLSQ